MTAVIIDATHAINRRRRVDSANSHPAFPIQNLPLGVFEPREGASRGGVAIGDKILDLAAAPEAGLFSGEARDAADAASAPRSDP